MQRGERSNGITLAAIVVFLGSAVAALFCVACLLSLSSLPRPGPVGAPPSNIAPEIRTSLMVGWLFYLVLTCGGFATGVGLLQRKAWARASILVFSGLMLFGSAMGSIALLLLPPIGRGVPGQIAQGQARGVTLAILAVPVLIAVWWLVCFNLKEVKKQFEEYATTGEYSRDDGSAATVFLKPQRPLSITLIALMYLLGAPFLLIAPFSDYPIVLFGFVITGNAARVLYLLYLPLVVYVGVGLLKLQEPARLVAIALSTIHFVSTLCFAVLPGQEGRLKTLFDLMHVELPPPMTVAILMPFIRFACVFGLGLTLVLIWLLVTRRAAFVKQAAQPAS